MSFLFLYHADSAQISPAFLFFQQLCRPVIFLQREPQPLTGCPQIHMKAFHCGFHAFDKAFCSAFHFSLSPALSPALFSSSPQGFLLNRSAQIAHTFQLLSDFLFHFDSINPGKYFCLFFRLQHRRQQHVQKMVQASFFPRSFLCVEADEDHRKLIIAFLLFRCRMAAFFFGRKRSKTECLCFFRPFLPVFAVIMSVRQKLPKRMCERTNRKELTKTDLKCLCVTVI